MPQVITIVTGSPTNRPRIAWNAILLGQGTVLAHREIQHGCWALKRSTPESLAALLSVAYGKRINASDALPQTILKAAELLGRDQSHAAAQMLASLPEPLPGCGDNVSLANRLLKSGIRPADLPTALRRAPWGCAPRPPTPPA